MKSLSIFQASHVKGELVFAGDKSIAHRALLISALSRGQTRIENFPNNKDCLYTLQALAQLGVDIIRRISFKCKEISTVTIKGKGLYSFKPARRPLFVGESGTTFRLLLGVLAGQPFATTLQSAPSLSRRPMRRVTQPLRLMGVQIKATRHSDRKGEEYPPLTIEGGNVVPIRYAMPIASAQVKSALLFAGLYSSGETRVVEIERTRDHTERMLRLFKARVTVKDKVVALKGGKELTSPGKIYIPGDISSASFFLVLATILPCSRLVLRRVGINPLRTGIISVLKRMGAKIRIKSSMGAGGFFEPIGDIIVESSRLRGTVISSREIPSLIDEIPIFMVAASFARGKTFIEGVEELRVKETDRIKSMTENLRKMGADIRISKRRGKEVIAINGIQELRGTSVRSYNDHRTAMSVVVAGLCAQGRTTLDDAGCIAKSFPDFQRTLASLRIHWK
jgi:3-phosphoshikimate 1-carboxyvinyltransferase